MVVKVIDLSYLKESSLEDTEFVVEMMELYLKNIAKYKEEIALALKMQRLKDVQESAHKFKSTLAIMGVKDLVSVLSDLEYMETLDKTCIEAYYKGEEVLDESIKEINFLLQHPEYI